MSVNTGAFKNVLFLKETVNAASIKKLKFSFLYAVNQIEKRL